MGGRAVTHAGMIDTYDATLYRLAGYMPNVAGVALTEQTAAWVGGWANTMITGHIRCPEGFDAAGDMVKPEDMKSRSPIHRWLW